VAAIITTGALAGAAGWAFLAGWAWARLGRRTP
jgi:hypothetical protein